MTTENGEHGDDDPVRENAADAAGGTGDCAFRIRDFSDLRRLRNAYLRRDGKPIGVDSADNPVPDEAEEDFGLTKSTAEEALEFLRCLREEEETASEDDELREFLDDE